MVYRVYVERKEGFENEAKELYKDLKTFLGIKGLTKVRTINRYDVENIEKELFEYAKNTVFSEPQTDMISEEIETDGGIAIGVEYLPGQFDQRADSAAQCLQIISKKERPVVRTAKIYVLYGNLTESEIKEIKKYVINPVEAREAGMEKRETLAFECRIPTEVETVKGFTELDKAGLKKFIEKYGLAMDESDAEFCRDYFRKEKRDPTITEIRMIDTYWSDHCRHTTFLTTIDKVENEDENIEKTYKDYLAVREELNRKKPINLMDLATIGTKYLKKHGKLNKLDESEEINACTVKTVVDQIIAQGYVSGRPTLGIVGETLSSFYQHYYRMPAGLYITQVLPESDACIKGIEEGDLLLYVNDNSITSMEDLKSVILNCQVGQTVQAVIYRGGKQYQLELTLTEDRG